MTNINAGIDWIFTSIATLFTYAMTTWVLSIFVLGSLLTLVIKLYLSARNK